MYVCILPLAAAHSNEAKKVSHPRVGVDLSEDTPVGRHLPAMLSSMKPHVRVLMLAACCTTSWTFKLTESPIQLSDSNNETANRMIEEVVSENMQRDMNDINGLPNPGVDNKSESSEGFGELAKNLEFLLLKVAQLETVAEMHEASIQEQAKVIQAQQEEINALKGESHKDGAVLLEMHKDSQTRLNEAQDLVQRVMLKQTRQRQTRDLAAFGAANSASGQTMSKTLGTPQAISTKVSPRTSRTHRVLRNRR